jgi:hypothetical protein
MLVLGKPNDKGTQLEKLTARLLAEKHYRNVCRNWIGPGGEEIDVRAEYVIPTLTDKRTLKVICECKAYKSAVDMSDWLKFCGKIYVEQQTQNEETHGCFVALSGVTGNVRGNYDELKNHGAKLELIAGDDLLDMMRQVYCLSGRKAILEIVKSLTDRVCRVSEVLYYEEQVYWLLLFEQDAYTVLRGDGTLLTNDEIEHLKQMIEEALSAKQYVNLNEEGQAKRRALVAESAVICHIMLNDGRAHIPTVSPCEMALTPQEMKDAGERLVGRKIIDGDVKGQLEIPDDDYKKVAVVFRTLFTGVHFTDRVLGCKWYDDHINCRLFEEIKTIQFGLPLSEDEVDTALELMKLSPRALANGLNPIGMIVEHRKNCKNAGAAQVMDQMDRDYFMHLLFGCLQLDFMHPAFSQYFYEKRGLRELDLSGACRVKTKTMITVQQEYRQRLAIGPFAELEGHYIVVLQRNDWPDPWEKPFPPEISTLKPA